MRKINTTLLGAVTSAIVAGCSSVDSVTVGGPGIQGNGSAIASSPAQSELDGYLAELRLPRTLIGPRLSFAVVDVDDPDTRALVEVGSFRGKGTTVIAGVVRAIRPEARVFAVDPHDGVMGALDRGLSHEGPTLEQFRDNIARTGLDTVVETIQSKASDVA